MKLGPQRDAAIASLSVSLLHHASRERTSLCHGVGTAGVSDYDDSVLLTLRSGRARTWLIPRASSEARSWEAASHSAPRWAGLSGHRPDDDGAAAPGEGALPLGSWPHLQTLARLPGQSCMVGVTSLASQIRKQIQRPLQNFPEKHRFEPECCHTQATASRQLCL